MLNNTKAVRFLGLKAGKAFVHDIADRAPEI